MLRHRIPSHRGILKRDIQQNTSPAKSCDNPTTTELARLSKVYVSILTTTVVTTYKKHPSEQFHIKVERRSRMAAFFFLAGLSQLLGVSSSSSSTVLMDAIVRTDAPKSFSPSLRRFCCCSTVKRHSAYLMYKLAATVGTGFEKIA